MYLLHFVYSAKNPHRNFLKVIEHKSIGMFAMSVLFHFKFMSIQAKQTHFLAPE